MRKAMIFKDEISLVLCGAAGQGIQTVEHLLTKSLKLSGYNLFATKEFMSRIRGGNNSTSIRVGAERLRAFSDHMDILVPLNEGAVTHVRGRIGGETLVLGEEKVFAGEYQGGNAINIPLTETAKEVGGAIFTNTVAAAVLLRLFEVDQGLLTSFLRSQFSDKGAEVVAKNIKAAEMGYQIGEEVVGRSGIKIAVRREPRVADEILINGTQAVAMGALAGGCNFVAFYPMTPGTGVPTFLAAQAERFGTIVEQAEDEIAAMNMVVASWYAGGRAMVSTSGGGFALMVEGLSLSGMLETPAVVHLGQRPGPATGLPTRTEQADLLFSLYSAHGEFPRVIYAPGTIADGFQLTRKAFDVADRYQVPVIILTDQHYVDSYYNLPAMDVPDVSKPHLVQTDRGYGRYVLTPDGLSPRGIPGHGDGLVCADSDEHDEEGRITEDLELRAKMVEKRLRKGKLLAEDAIQPELCGDRDYRDLVIGWGSTYGAIREAVDRLGRKGLAFLSFKQVYPLPSSARGHLERARRTVLVENNATGQFGKLLRQEAGISVDREILKWDGLPFSVEGLTKGLKEALA